MCLRDLPLISFICDIISPRNPTTRTTTTKLEENKEWKGVRQHRISSSVVRVDAVVLAIASLSLL